MCENFSVPIKIIIAISLHYIIDIIIGDRTLTVTLVFPVYINLKVFAFMKSFFSLEQIALRIICTVQSVCAHHQLGF